MRKGASLRLEQTFARCFGFGVGISHDLKEDGYWVARDRFMSLIYENYDFGYIHT
jgi:hypothetical protein